jgi:hypothetical protein
MGRVPPHDAAHGHHKVDNELQMRLKLEQTQKQQQPLGAGSENHKI